MPLVTVVTGGATGLGRSQSMALHAAGAHVVVVGRRKEKLDELQKELGSERVRF